MTNKYVRLICSAILVCNMPSFCSNWSGTITRQSSASYREKLDNLQNGLIPQQQNNIQQNRNTNNQQQNNINQQQVNNDDLYGEKVFDKCLTKLSELENIIECNTKRLNEYIQSQKKEKYMDEFLNRKKQNSNLYFDCLKVITEIKKVNIEASKQQHYNNKIIKLNNNKRKDLSDEKDKIYTEINNIDSNITKLEDSRVKELEQIQDCIFHEQNNISKTKQDRFKQWYNLADYEEDIQIENCNKTLSKIENLYTLYKNKDEEYNRIIKENQENKKKLETTKDELNKRINHICNKNQKIRDIYNYYKVSYNNNYLDLFKEYNKKLMECNQINSEKYEEEKDKYCSKVLERELARDMAKFNISMNLSFRSYSTRNIFNDYRYNTISNW